MLIVPVENSTVRGRYPSSFAKFWLENCRRAFQPVNHQLGIKGGLSDIPMPIRMNKPCPMSWVEAQNIAAVTHADTAGAAKDIAAKGEAHHAAIASRLAAEIYGLDILKENFEDMDSNTTRFLMMAPDAPIASYDSAKKYVTTMVFRVRSVPAALYKALGGFNGVNMTKIESYMLGGAYHSAILCRRSAY